MNKIRTNNYVLGVVYLFAFLAGIISLTSMGVDMPKPINPFNNGNANTGSAGGSGNTHPLEGNLPKNHPCNNLKTACEGAGFYKGGWKQGKGLWKNCMNPLMSGQSVAGVNVNSGDITSCQTRKANRKNASTSTK